MAWQVTRDVVVTIDGDLIYTGDDESLKLACGRGGTTLQWVGGYLRHKADHPDCGGDCKVAAWNSKCAMAWSVVFDVVAALKIDDEREAADWLDILGGLFPTSVKIDPTLLQVKALELKWPKVAI